MHRMARLRPRASAVPELMFSTSRCLTFFNTGAREKGPMSVLLTRPSRPEPHHNCRLCQRMEKTGLGLGVWSGQEAAALGSVCPALPVLLSSILEEPYR